MEIFNDRICEIEGADNGFILSYVITYSEGSQERKKLVFEEKKDSNVKPFIDMVCFLMDLYSIYDCSVKFFDKNEKEIIIDDDILE